MDRLHTRVGSETRVRPKSRMVSSDRSVAWIVHREAHGLSIELLAARRSDDALRPPAEALEKASAAAASAPASTGSAEPSVAELAVVHGPHAPGRATVGGSSS